MATLTDQIMVTISASAAGAISEFRRLDAEAAKTGDGVNKKFSGLGDTLKSGLVAGAAAFVGTGLVRFLGDSVDAFGDAAKMAGELAGATGGTVENVSRMQAALEDAGISADESAQMMTKFTQNAEKNAGLLDDLGVEFKRNKDGTIDYADAMVQAIDAINDIGDAATRNKAFVDLFGRGAPQKFQELAASGVKLSDAMEAISKYRVFSAEDIKRAADYDNAMDDLSANIQEVKFGLGRALIPLLSDAADAFGDLVGAISPVLELFGEIPGETTLMIGGFVLLNAAMKSTLVTNALSYAGSFAASMITSFVAVGTGAVSMSAVVRTAMTAMSTALMANPVTAALVLIAAGLAAVQFASQHAQDEVAGMADRWKELEESGMESSAALAQTAEEWMKTASTWDKISMEGENWGWLKYTGPLGSFITGLRDANTAEENFIDISQDARDEMGEFAYQTADAANEMKTLKDMIANGETGTQKFRDAVEESGAAQAEVNAITEQTNALMETYASTHEEAVDAARDLFDAQFDLHDSQKDYNDALQDYKDLDPAATADEHREALDNVLEGALNLADGWAEERRQALENSGITISQLQVRQLQIDKLKEIRDAAKESGVPQTVIDSYDTMIGTLETAQTVASGGVEVDVSIATMTPQEIDTKITELKNRIRDAAQSGNFGLADALQTELDALTGYQEGGVAVNVNTTFVSTGYDAVDAQISTLAEPQTATITIDSEFTPDGYNAILARKTALTNPATGNLTIHTTFDPAYNDVKARLDFINSMDGKSPDINIYSHFDPAYNDVKARLDYINSMDGKTPDITVWTHFEPGGYESIASRIRYLSTDRTVNINFKTNGLSAAVAAVNSMNTSGSNKNAVAQQFRMPTPQPAPQPINIVKVSVDGQQLRATIREELGLIRASDDLLAARGVVA